MRVLITRRGSLDVPDGINIFVLSLAQGLMRRNHEVTLAATTVGSVEKAQAMFGMRLMPNLVGLSTDSSVNSQRLRTILLWWKRGRQLAKTIRPDLAIINGSLPFHIGGESCVVAHDAEKRLTSWGPFRRTYKALAYRQASGVVATCSELRTAVSKESFYPAHTIQVIPTCVDLRNYTPLPYRQRHNAVLHMGTAPYKNPVATINALSSGLFGDAHLYMTGNLDERLKGVISDLAPNVRDRVEFLGYVSGARLRELLGTVKIVSVPSRYVVPVASPTVLEAFASGTPVVGSSGISGDLLVDRVNGLKLTATSEGAPSKFDFLLEDEAAWAELSTNALATAQRFSAERVAQSYEGLLLALQRRAA